jgi:DNA-binding FrmR family transcriptional regulator
MHHTEEERLALEKRLNRIEGQVRGIKKMLVDDRYCGEVLDQLSSIQSALRGVSKTIARNHLETCVTDALRSGKPARAAQTYDEIMHLLYDQIK